MGHRKWIIATCSVVALVATTAGIAYARISATSGSISYLSAPPASVKLNVLENATKVHAFDERQGVALASSVAVDALVTNTTTFPVNPVTTFPNGNATIPAGTVVDSHLIHSDIPQSGSRTTSRTATLTFDTPILGVIGATSRLAATDAALGSPTTQYAGNLTWRGLESSSGGNMENNSRGNDSFTITGANTLSINLNTLYMDEIRVLTKHPLPVAVNDSYSVNVPNQLSVNVLANDSNPGGVSPLTAVLVSSPDPLKAQSFSLGSNGSLTYTPYGNATGTDTFTYQAKDGSGVLSTVATVTITLNQAPVAHDDSTFSTDVNTTVNGSIATDVTDDGPAPLTFSLVPGQGPSHAAAFTLNADGSFSYTPADGYSDPATPDTFTYRATDGAGAVSNPATVSITVYPVVTFNQPATVSDGDTSGTFSLIDPNASGKRYSSSADAETHTIRFVPSGSAQQVAYRAYLNFGPDPTTTAGTLTPGTLDYDPTGGTDFRPLRWCLGPAFDASHNVTSATLPAGESWCIASAASVPDANGIVTTTWQTYGIDDPTARRR